MAKYTISIASCKVCGSYHSKLLVLDEKHVTHVEDFERSISTMTDPQRLRYVESLGLQDRLETLTYLECACV